MSMKTEEINYKLKKASDTQLHLEHILGLNLTPLERKATELKLSNCIKSLKALQS